MGAMHIFTKPSIIYPLRTAFKHFISFRFSRLQDYCMSSLRLVKVGVMWCSSIFANSMEKGEEDDQEDPSDVVDHAIKIILNRKVSFNISIIKHLTLVYS